MALDELDMAAYTQTGHVRYGDLIDARHRFAGGIQVGSPVALAAKRAIDVVVAGVSVVLLAPLFGVLALGVALTSRGGVIFRHERVGRDGVRFKVLKFRTMTVGTHDRIWSDPERAEAFKASGFKLAANDPSITRFGRFLRKTSLDELPQLINVLRGEMSLVGVRPLVPVEVAARSAYEQDLYRAMNPGITGLWQVNGRSSVEHEDRCTLDREYVEQWSLMSDISILVRTPFAVLRPHHTA